MEIKRTRIVAFPRSGHHWLLRMLRSNLGNSIRYGSAAIDGLLLERFQHINLQTEHDMTLETRVNIEFQHIVQYREDFDAAFNSFWQLKKRPRDKRDSIKTLRAELFEKWKDKWVHSDIPNRLVITYEDLLVDPLEQLRQAYVFLTGIEPPILVVELPRPGIGHYDTQTDGDVELN